MIQVRIVPDKGFEIELDAPDRERLENVCELSTVTTTEFIADAIESAETRVFEAAKPETE